MFSSPHIEGVWVSYGSCNSHDNCPIAKLMPIELIMLQHRATGFNLLPRQLVRSLVSQMAD
jgi:hypothetical protein